MGCGGVERAMPETDAAAAAGSTTGGVAGAGGGAGQGGGGDGGQGGSGGAACAPALVACGQTRCHVEQSCVDGACRWPCAGVTVPGDFATVQEAVDAMAAGGTICVGPGTFAETVTVTPDGDLTIRGADARATRIDAVKIEGGSGAVTVEGLAAGYFESNSLDVHVRACDLGGSTAVIGLTVLAPMEPYSVYVEGTRIAGDFGAVELQDLEQSAKGSVVLENCSVHGSKYGIDGHIHHGPGASLELTGCFFAGFETAVHPGIAFGGFSVTVLQSVFVDNGLAIEDMLGGGPFGAGHNVFFGNGADYQSGTAYPADVVTDPLLDDGDPPEPLLGSPCIDGGDPAVGSGHDFYGAVRWRAGHRARGERRGAGRVSGRPTLARWHTLTQRRSRPQERRFRW